MRLFSLLLLTIALTACENKKGGASVMSETGDDVRNDISLKANGVKVEQAFLLFEDGKLVPEGNKIEVGQKVMVRLLIEGWKPQDGKVFLGASEKISTNDGKVFLDEKDLFASNGTGIDAADAGSITLSAIITGIDKLYKYFEVSFKVWDKKSSDNVTGSYRLYLK